MKKILLFTLIIFTICFSGWTTANAADLPAGVPHTIPLGEYTISINMDWWNAGELIVYGCPSEINLEDIPGNNIAYNGEWRYIGYTSVGNPFPNPSFPDDYASTAPPWNKHWIDEPWDNPINNVITLNEPLYPLEPDESNPFQYNLYKQAVLLLDHVLGDDPATRDDPRMAKNLEPWYGKPIPGAGGATWCGEELITKLPIQTPPASAFFDPNIMYSPGLATGVHRWPGHTKAYYQSFDIEPLYKYINTYLPDVKVEITYPTAASKPSLAQDDPGPLPFTATIRATLVDDRGYDPSWQPKVIYRYIVNGAQQPWQTSLFTKTTAGEYEDYSLSCELNHGDNIVIQAVINPVLNAVGNPLMDSNGNAFPDYSYVEDLRLFKEARLPYGDPAYDNNYFSFSFADLGTPAASENKYLYLGVYPATEGLKEFKDIIEVHASFKPEGNTNFDEVSWDTPSNSISRPTGEPEVSVKPKPEGISTERLNYASGSSFSLSSTGNFLDPDTDTDIEELLKAIFGSGDVNGIQSLSCQDHEQSEIDALGTNPVHHSSPGHGEGGCVNEGDAY